MGPWEWFMRAEGQGHGNGSVEMRGRGHEKGSVEMRGGAMVQKT